MGEPDDLFQLYRSDRTPNRALQGHALSGMLADNVRRTFSIIEGLTAEVVKALAEARYTIRLSPRVVDRARDLRFDRTSQAFRDYVRVWSQERVEARGGGLHWEATLQVADHRRNSMDIGLGVTIEWPSDEPAADVAFVELWSNGQGVALPSESRAFQRAVVASIMAFEDAGTLKSAKPRP